jgi:hypothetical protein
MRGDSPRRGVDFAQSWMAGKVLGAHNPKLIKHHMCPLSNEGRRFLFPKMSCAVSYCNCVVSELVSELLSTV